MKLRYLAIALTTHWLLIAATSAPLAAQESIPAMDPGDAEAERTLMEALETIIDVRFVEMPLGDGVAQIARQIRAPFQIDSKKLEEASVSLDQPVTIALRGLSARNVLTLMLRPLELGWVVKDRVVFITTKEEVDQTLTTRVYPVLDLTGGRDYNSLIDVITSTIAPTSWDEVGGPGSVSVLRAAGSLVFSQTQEIHEQVAMLLTALRAARDRQGLTATSPLASIHGIGTDAVLVPNLAPPKVSRATRSADAPRYSFSAGASWQRPQTHE